MWFSSAFFRNFWQKHRVSGLFCCFPWCLCLGGSKSFQFRPKIIGYKDFKNFKAELSPKLRYFRSQTQSCVEIPGFWDWKGGKCCNPQPHLSVLQDFLQLNSKYQGSTTLTDFCERFFLEVSNPHENAKKKMVEQMSQKLGLPHHWTQTCALKMYRIST